MNLCHVRLRCRAWAARYAANISLLSSWQRTLVCPATLTTGRESSLRRFSGSFTRGGGSFTSEGSVIDCTDIDEQKSVTKVETLSSARDVVEKIFRLPDLQSRNFACDTEVADIDLKIQGPVGNGRVICASVFAGDDLDFGNGPRLWIDNLDAAEGLLMEFREFFERDDIKKTWHNYAFDRHVLFNHGIDARGFGGDTMHMARLWDSSRQGRGGYSLESLSADFLGVRKVPMKQRFGVPKKKKDGSDGKETVLPPVDHIQRDPATRDQWIDYSCYDAESTWRLRELLHRALEGQVWHPHKKGHNNMYEFYRKWYVPFGECLTDLERIGIYVDCEYLRDMQQGAEKEWHDHEKLFLEWAQKICPAASRMNVSSDGQKQTLFFAPCKNSKTKELMPKSRAFKVENIEGFIEEGKKKAKKERDMVLEGIGLQPVQYTESGWPAVSSSVLRKLAGRPRDNPPVYGTAFDQLGGGKHGHDACVAINSVVEMSSIETMLQTFLIPLQELADSKGRVHCSLNINTETGRLSSRQPNLQNQPALEKDRYKIRHAFRAMTGHKLLVADYGQLELRVLAHITNCASMLKAFRLGGDFHSRTAMGMYEYIADAVTSGEVLLEWNDSCRGPPPAPLLKDRFASERRKAKILNFSIAYGKTAHGLAKDFGVSSEEAQATVDKWYADRPEVKLWQEKTIKRANKMGYTYTFMGRRRYLPDALKSPGEKLSKIRRKLQGHAERAAINTPIQGSAADIVMAAMIKIHTDTRLREIGWQLILQIHDEVILEGPENTADEALRLVRESMERPFEVPLRVDLVVDAKVATTWYEAK